MSDRSKFEFENQVMGKFPPPPQGVLCFSNEMLDSLKINGSDLFNIADSLTKHREIQIKGEAQGIAVHCFGFGFMVKFLMGVRELGRERTR